MLCNILCSISLELAWDTGKPGYFKESDQAVKVVVIFIKAAKIFDCVTNKTVPMLKRIV